MRSAPRNRGLILVRTRIGLIGPGVTALGDCRSLRVRDLVDVRGESSVYARGHSRDDEGASAVEFALVSVVLILFLVGIVQFGYTFFQYLEVVHSAREGARWAALGVEAGSVSDPTSVRGRVAAAAPGLSPGLTDASITVSVAGGGSQAVIPADSGKPVTVGISYSSPIFMPLLGDIVGGGAFALQSSATLRVE